MAKKNKDKKAAKPAKASKVGKTSKAEKDKKAKKKAKKLAPVAVKTGKGATPLEVGTQLVKMFNEGKFEEIEKMFWSPKITSIEGVGVGMAWTGRKAVEAKNAAWMSTHKIHGATAEGPYVGSTGFAVKLQMDVEDTATNKRMTMNEIGVYTIKGGKIVQEEFMYGM